MRLAIKLLSSSHTTIYRLIQAGELDDFRYSDGGWHWVTMKSIDRYLLRRQRPQRKAPTKTSARKK